MAITDTTSLRDETTRELETGALTPEKLLARLRSALQRDGDFPASAKVVSELRRLTSDPKTTANQITEVILKEPSLGTRVLHLVNSSFYQRAKPIMTVSQAVIQIGMKPLAELCSGLILLQKFVPAARRGGPFAGCLQKTICTSLLAGSIGASVADEKSDSGNELGYLSGSFAELGTLLLAYYFPQVYETAVKRARLKNQDIGQSIQEITGVTPLELSLEVVDALKLPEFYKGVLEYTNSIVSGAGSTKPHQNKAIENTARALNAAEKISNVVVFKKSKGDLDEALSKIKHDCGIEPARIDQIIGELPAKFKDHCSTIEINLTALPEFVATYTSEPEAPNNTANTPPAVDKFAQFLDEIRQAIEAREPTSAIITTVMETMAWGLRFDRVLLILFSGPNKKVLSGRMLLGRSDIDPKSIIRHMPPKGLASNPEVLAVNEGRAIFSGEPIIFDGWPFTVIPVGLAQRTVGVIYADRINQKDVIEITERERAAIGVLTELLDRSISSHS